MPKIDSSCFIADGAVIAGEVEIKANASIWFNSVIRGDVAAIYIGQNTNIQDGTVIHTSRNNGPTHIGSDITIGHQALIHACTIKEGAFIGMRAIVMDHAIIEEQAFVAAGSLVTPGKKVKYRELWAGHPAKFVRMVTEKELNFMHENAIHYCKLAAAYIGNN